MNKTQLEIVQSMWKNHKAQIYANVVGNHAILQDPNFNLEWFCDNDGFYSTVENIPGGDALEMIWCSHGMDRDANDYIAWIWVRVLTQLDMLKYKAAIEHITKTQLEGL